jgi:hypothetical protein
VSSSVSHGEGLQEEERIPRFTQSAGRRTYPALHAVCRKKKVSRASRSLQEEERIPRFTHLHLIYT